MSKALVSIILSTYNDERFIGETIASVLSQTYDNFEFIIWNDGSTDGTEGVIKTFSDPRIVYYFHENTGVGQARNLATAKARGKYIAVIDGDDVCMPNRIEVEVAYMEHHPECVLLSSQMLYINEDGDTIGQSFISTSDFVIRKRISYTSLLPHPACMYRKDIYDQTGGYCAIHLGEDNLLFSRLMKYGKAHNLHEPLIKYRVRRNSLMHSICYNPYNAILTAYREKLVNDEVVSKDDIVEYNRIYSIGRKAGEIRKEKKSPTSIQDISKEEWLFNVVKLCFGESAARNIVISLKNLVLFVKYKILIT